jgi:hypothetical protein
VLVVGLALTALLPLVAQIRPVTPNSGAPIRSFNALPLQFVPYRSHKDQATQMQTHALGGTITFLPQHILLALPDTDPLQIQFIGANATTTIIGGEQLPALVNDVHGNDPVHWRTNIPTYASLTYQALYPGIDLRYDGTLGALKGTYLVQPHVDPAEIGWRYQGVQQVQIDPKGNLNIVVQNGHTLTEQAPVAWQDIEGQRVMVDVRYTLKDGRIGFAVGSYNPAHPLIIDPALAYGTFLGGSANDESYGITLDPQGNIYLTGRTYSDDFPATQGAGAPDRDVFVTKFDPTGTRILYSTIIGGSQADDGHAIAVSAAGEAVISVYTSSDDFPIKNPLLDTLPANSGALLKLTPTGALAFSTYLNADMYETNRNVGIDQGGNIYLAGGVDDGDIGVIKLAGDGQKVLAEATIGGRGRDNVTAIVVRGDGHVYMTGSTEAYRNNFPVTPDALQPECARESADPDASCSREAFLTILDANLQTRYSSFLGGSYLDQGAGIALDGQGNIAVVGTTYSSDFPIQQAFQPVCPDGVAPDNSRHCNSYESFVTRFSPDGKQLLFSTFVSSSDWSADVVKDVAVDHAGVLYLLGWTNSTKYPVKDATQPHLSVGICGTDPQREEFCEDAVVTALAPDGTLVYSTYLGGKHTEYPYSIAVDANNNVWITGSTLSRDLPTTAGAFQSQKSLNEDGFLIKLGHSGGTLPPPGGLDKKVFLPLTQR